MKQEWIDALAAIMGYSDHDEDCKVNDWHGIPECTCGYLDAQRNATKTIEEMRDFK